MDENDPNQSENQDAKLKFNEDLANQEWVNERDSIRYRLFGSSAAYIVLVMPRLAGDIWPVFQFNCSNILYYIHQNKFEKSLPLGNRICSIDTGFAKNIEYNQMFKQKYFVDIEKPREIFYGAQNTATVITAYVQSYVMKKCCDNQEIRNLMKADIDVERISDTDKGLKFENISLEDRKKFNDITNGFFDLLNTYMKSVAEFLIKHKSYSHMFFIQGIMHQLSLNLNVDKSDLQGYAKDIERNNFGVQADDYNSRKQETLSYDSRYMILCFFRPKYLFSDEKPDSKLIEFYVALNSLLSVTEKENAKAILNSDDEKLTEQQKDLKKKLSGEDEKFRNNIINAWKDGFFLDKNKIQESDELFTEKEKKLEDDFNKINKDDLNSKCFIYDEKNGFVKIIDWLISEIENGNLKLMSQEQNKDLKNDLSSANNNDDKVKFLVSQLFNGASVVDKNKNDITYLKFSDDERDKYSKSDLQEKLKLIDNKIQSCPKAAKILKPSDCLDSTRQYYQYCYLKKKKLSELLYFQDDEQKHDYIYLRENKNYYRDYILHKDYGENELYNKLYQCTQKADFGKYKREHFIFDETGKIIGMDVLAYFADKIVSGKLKLKDNKGKDISDEVKNIDNDLAREVFLMNKLKDNACYVFDNENNKIELDENDTTRITQIVEELQKTIKNFNTENDFIKMFRLEKEDVEKIVKDKHQPHALMYRYALNKIFTEKIKPVNHKDQELINKYVFDFSGTNCEQDDLVFAKDGRVEYVRYESLPKVLKLDNIETNEFKARNGFIGAYGKKEKYKYDKPEIEIYLRNVKINSEELSNKLKEKYKVNEKNLNSATDELNDLRTNLDSNACTNLNDFYDFDSYRDELLDEYIKFYQNAGIDYEYWCSECAQKFLKDKKAKEVKNDDEIADIELQFLKGQKIELKDLSQYTRQNKKQEITSIIELQKFRNREIGYENLSQYTKGNKGEEIAEIEFKLLKENKLIGDRKKIRQLQKQKSKLMSVYYRLAPGKINNKNKLKQVCIGGETILYFLEDTDNQQLENDINTFKRQNISLYKSNNIPYKRWDSDAKEDYFDKLQWKLFKIGCIPLSILILSVVSFFLPFIEGYLVIKIIFTSGSFVCGCLVAGKGIKNKKDRDYRGKDTYDSSGYSYPNDNFVVPEVNGEIQQLNVDQKFLESNSVLNPIVNENINTSSKTSSSNNKQSKNDPEDTNINTNSTSSSSSGSSEQSHESTTDLRQCTDPNFLEINLKHLKPGPLTTVNEIKTEGENNIPEFDPKNKTENVLRDKNKNI